MQRVWSVIFNLIDKLRRKVKWINNNNNFNEFFIIKVFSKSNFNEYIVHRIVTCKIHNIGYKFLYFNVTCLNFFINKIYYKEYFELLY